MKTLHGRHIWQSALSLKTTGIWVLAFAVIGAGLVLLTHAATPVAGREAESGTAINGAISVSDSTASGGAASKFGSPASSAAPTRLRAFTGGDSIALRWEPVSSTYNPVKYHVFRNGAEVSVITLAQAIQYTYENKGTAYYDFAVTPGQTYSYQVQAELANGSQTNMSPAIQVTHPTQTTPVPTVSIQYNGLPQAQYATFVNEAKNTLRVWYPKAVDLLVKGSYAVPNNLTISIIDHNLGCSGSGWAVNSSTYNECDDYAMSNPYDMSVVVHEITHSLQSYTTSNTSKMVVEGLASWMGDNATGYTQPKPSLPITYADGYGYSSYFFSWILSNYNVPTLPHDMNIATKSGTGDAIAVIKQLTGKTAGQLWSQIAGSYVSTLGPITGAAGTCVKPLDGNPGTLLTTFACNAQPFWQGVVYIAKPSQPTVGLIKFAFSETVCLRTANQSLASAAYVVVGSCDFNVPTALWQQQADGSLKNVGSNYCMQPSGGKTVDGTNMLVSDCTNASTTPTRRWALPGA